MISVAALRMQQFGVQFYQASLTASDIDKLVRAVNDSATSAGAWGDDAQVVELSARKTYADEATKPGCLIHIQTIKDEQ